MASARVAQSARLLRAAADHAARLRARCSKISETMLELYRDPLYRERVRAKRAGRLVQQ